MSITRNTKRISAHGQPYSTTPFWYYAWQSRRKSYWQDIMKRPTKWRTHQLTRKQWLTCTSSNICLQWKQLTRDEAESKWNKSNGTGAWEERQKRRMKRFKWSTAKSCYLSQGTGVLTLKTDTSTTKSSIHTVVTLGTPPNSCVPTPLH